MTHDGKRQFYVYRSACETPCVREALSLQRHTIQSVEFFQQNTVRKLRFAPSHLTSIRKDASIDGTSRRALPAPRSKREKPANIEAAGATLS